MVPLHILLRVLPALPRTRRTLLRTLFRLRRRSLLHSHLPTRLLLRRLPLLRTRLRTHPRTRLHTRLLPARHTLRLLPTLHQSAVRRTHRIPSLRRSLPAPLHLWICSTGTGSQTLLFLLHGQHQMRASLFQNRSALHPVMLLLPVLHRTALVRLVCHMAVLPKPRSHIFFL